MQSGASQTEITFEIRFGNSVIRQISVQLQALLDDSPDDKERGIRKYVCRIEDNGQEKLQYWYSNEAEALRRFLLAELQAIVDQVDHEKYEIIVTKDTEGLFGLENCYCEHCGRLFLQHYGPLAGIIKKCRSCSRLTRCQSQKVRAK